ncbi:TolC family protein [Flavobacterium sp.]|jgi:outer membrane protein TolC|uniref:TolC family protein n=1 Tax=Flavobacterium sp. TaxID=239 RepID=UPI0037C01C35
MKQKLTLLCLIIASTLFAQEAKKSYSFSLEQAIEHAVKNNYSMINANRDVEAAKKKKWETTTMGLPQLNGSVNYQNTFEFTKQGAAANAFNPAANPNDIVLLAFGTKHVAIGNLTLSQLIFDGSYLVGLQSAKTYLQISENAKIKTAQEIREIVINSYGNVLLADESIKILENNKKILEKTFADTKEIFKNGLIEEENVEQLQITLASLTSSLENVKRQKRIALDMLKLLLGIEIEEELIITDQLSVLTQNNIDLVLLKKEFDAKNTIDYQIGKNLEKSKELILKLEKSKALPSLAAQLNFGYNSFANQFNFLNTTQQWNNFSNVGVGLNVPIFSSLGRSARTQQAKIALEQAKTNVTETEQKLKLQFEKAKSDYEFSIEQLATSKSNLNLAERIENKNQIKFKEGLSSSFDLTDAQRQLYSAQQTYLQAMLDVINKKATLEKLLN